MENEDYKIVELYNNNLKVYRDGRIETLYIYKNNCVNNKYKKGEFKWKLKKPVISKCGHYRLGLWCNGKRKDFFSHRIIAYAFIGLDIYNTKEIIDHIDCNKLNNDWFNLRIVTSQQNNFNWKDTKGYYFRDGKYEAKIGVNRKNYHLGTYNTKEEAHNAYLEAKKKYHQY